MNEKDWALILGGFGLLAIILAAGQNKTEPGVRTFALGKCGSCGEVH